MLSNEINRLMRRMLVDVVASGVVISLAGCMKNSSSPTSSGQSSTVQGQVSGQQGLAKRSASSTGVQGATVVLAQIQVDGSLKTVSTSSVQTDAAGHFSVNTNLNGVNDLVVTASQGTKQWEAIVSGEVKNGGTTYCQPLTDQTTVQAQAFSKIIADGKGSEVGPADLELFVTTALAENVSGNASAIAQLATSLEDESEAQSIAFTQFNITTAQLQTVAAARQQTQVSLESALYGAAGDTAADQSALQSYYATTAGAYIAAGVPVQVLAKTEEIACSALENFSVSMSSGPELAVDQSASLVRAAIVGQAVLSEMESGGASQSEIASVDSANTALLAALNLAASSRDMENAFASYHAAIVAQLEAMDGSSGSAISTADASIESTGGPMSVLRTSLSAATTTGDIVQAYMTFYGSINSMMQGMGGMGSAQLDASTQVLMLVDSN